MQYQFSYFSFLQQHGGVFLFFYGDYSFPSSPLISSGLYPILSSLATEKILCGWLELISKKRDLFRFIFYGVLLSSSLVWSWIQWIYVYFGWVVICIFKLYMYILVLYIGGVSSFEVFIHEASKWEWLGLGFFFFYIFRKAQHGENMPCFLVLLVV